ncbi:MAG: hypothetical protein KGM43_04470 [Planctomycetota bacterium]|nr:hypothetical protein [Planctomycetota bacterium]
MFTTEPPLSQRVERLIAETPLVDPHTHLRCAQPGAPDLASLMSYHWVQTELRAVGMPAVDFDLALPPEERVRRAIPYLRRMRNTAMAWCFRRILRDLYDFMDPEINDANYLDLCARVEERGRERAWALEVLTQRCGIKTFVTSLGNRAADPALNPPYARFMLDAHYLFCPGVATDLEPFFKGRTTKAEYHEALTSVLGEAIDTPERLRSRLRDWLEATVAGTTRYTNTYLPIEARFDPPDETSTRAVLTRAARGETLDDASIDELVRFVSWETLGWHHDHAKAFQIAVGAEYFICDGKSIPRYMENWTSQMARAFHHFGRVRFDLMVASQGLVHETAVLARQFPNVYVSGYWWHNFFPPLIEQIAALRLQVAPMTKFGGFLCDAYYAEWTYGKLRVISKALARALSRLVEAGAYDEDELPAILHQILHDTPRDLYDLAD